MKNNQFISDYFRQILPIIASYLLMIGLVLLLSLLDRLSFSLSMDLIRFSLPILLIYIGISFIFTRRRVHQLDQKQPIQPRNPVERQLMLNYQQLSQETTRQIQNIHRDKQEQLDHLELYAHEIKNSLAILQSQAENQDYLDHQFVMSAVHKTNYYLDLLLNEGRLRNSNHDFNFEWINLQKLIEEILKQDAAIFIARQLIPELKGIEHIQILTDRKWLRFCLRQLLSNAIKYSKKGQTIEIIWSQNALLIKDFGCGITSHDLPRIFENGFTGDNGHQTSKSTGMGLYLVNKVTAQLNFSITIDSQPDQGTTAKLIFPPENIRS